jgi:hypothetical protein
MSEVPLKFNFLFCNELIWFAHHSKKNITLECDTMFRVKPKEQGYVEKKEPCQARAQGEVLCFRMAMYDCF